ncbi:uncharacterized protein GLRG_06999 [Colletotrichum graminicola M1.001]|uniref:Uncharacterized protein n=1 Tax=Colletotrichum graminicola (strain M1.001 / M2 / FGSC 10212) TaxID=645133 RepID=E3QLW7_COLGM|nr:uncharacterized protein GLRG_06999 [Colletotrichum graminicola M1.001]EFQ31855.1 hypothetical protein GLRG_06999 [Colletotrichum graminicola M1.001]
MVLLSVLAWLQRTMFLEAESDCCTTAAAVGLDDVYGPSISPIAGVVTAAAW